MELMIDIETLGTQTDAVVLSVAAVWFAREDSAGPGGDAFHKHFHRFGPANLGRIIDPSTTKWWFGQEDEALDQLISGQKYALNEGKDRESKDQLRRMVEEADYVWAKGPDFDCRILESFLAAEGFKWPFWKNRDVRTMQDILGPDLPAFVGTQHNALADAVHQIKIVQMAWAKVKQ